VTFPGLEVGGPESIAGLLRGDWDFAQTGTVPVAEAVLNGGDAVILLRDSIRHDNIVIMTRPGITGLDQLSGRKVGVLTDAYSGQTGVIARLAVERAGAAARYVGLGTYRAIFAALNEDGYEGKVGLETHLFDGTLITAAHKSMDEIMKIVREV